MAKIALLLDEDVRTLLAEILPERGYDVIHVLEVERLGQDDPSQLLYAISQRRALLTHNIRDYRILARTYQIEQKEHYGIIVSNQLPLRELLRRLLRCLNQYDSEDAKNQIIWLHDFK